VSETRDRSDTDGRADTKDRPATKDRPVLTGLVALALVSLVIGLLAGLAMLVGVKTLGLGGDSGGGSGDAGSGSSLYLPKPTDTPTTSTPDETTESSPDTSESPETPAAAITLTAAQATVSPMQQIDLAGTYPTGEGAILQVQRLEGGEWSDFPVTASVSGQSFGTYVQTSRPGPNKFRVIDTDTQTTSNEVTVTVG
jgi:hypothetical protein